MEDREWRRREWERRENESFGDRDREAPGRREEGWRRDFDEDDWAGRLTAVSWAGWGTRPGSSPGFPGHGRWADVPRGRFTGRGPKNYQRSNERIREDVCERLTENPDLDAREIEIRVEDREVTLEGKVEDRHAKRLAEDLAEVVPGVRDVHNHLKVEEGFFSRLFGRDEEERPGDRDKDRARHIPIASETTAVDRPGGSTAVAAVGDAAVTGTDRTAAVSDTTPPSSAAPSPTSRSRPQP